MLHATNLQLVPTFARNVDNTTSYNNLSTITPLSSNVETTKCHIGLPLCATITFNFNNWVGKNKTLLFLKYKTNNSLFLQDVKRLQLNN
jgi:hypothetical protein